MKKNTAPKGIKIKMSREEIAYQIFIAVVVGLLVLCCLIPFLYVVGMSFTSEGEMIQRNFFVINNHLSFAFENPVNLFILFVRMHKRNTRSCRESVYADFGAG